MYSYKEEDPVTPSLEDAEKKKSSVRSGYQGRKVAQKYSQRSEHRRSALP